MKIIKGLFWGAATGLVIGIVVTVVIVAWPIVGCTLTLACELVTCFSVDPNLPAELNPSFGAGELFAFCISICTAIGLIWGIATTVRSIVRKNALKRAAAEKATIAREKENKVRMESDFTSVLNEFDSLVSYVNDGVDIQLYRNGYVTKGSIDALSTTCDNADRKLKRMDEEANSAGKNT